MPDRPRTRGADWEQRLRWPAGLLLVGLIAVALFSPHWLPILIVLVLSVLYLAVSFLAKRG